MSTSDEPSAVLTIRVGAQLARSLQREARHRRKSKSEVAREILTAGLAAPGGTDAPSEARRQSLLVSRRRSEREALELVANVADLSGWK